MQAVTILRAHALVDMPEIGIRKGDAFYVARDGRDNSIRAIKWERTRWVCSCGKGACDHKLQVNEFVFKRRITGGGR